MLFVQLAFSLEPIVHVVTMCSTAFEVQSICSLLDFLQTRGACELWLGPCRFSDLLFPVLHTCRRDFRSHVMSLTQRMALTSVRKPE